MPNITFFNLYWFIFRIHDAIYWDYSNMNARQKSKKYCSDRHRINAMRKTKLDLVVFGIGDPRKNVFVLNLLVYDILHF